MRTQGNEIRGSVVIGHRLEVYRGGGGHWNVAVDGEELLARSGTAYSAWAVGAAESYRQGRVNVVGDVAGVLPLVRPEVPPMPPRALPTAAPARLRGADGT